MLVELEDVAQLYRRPSIIDIKVGPPRLLPQFFLYPIPPLSSSHMQIHYPLV